MAFCFSGSLLYKLTLILCFSCFILLLFVTNKFHILSSSSVPFCAHRGRNLGLYEHVSFPTICKSGEKQGLNRGDVL